MVNKENSNTMTCGKCGKQVSDGNSYCGSCGAKTETADSPSIRVALEESDKKLLTSKNALAFAAVLIAVALFYYFFMRPRQEQQAYADCVDALKEEGYTNLILGSAAGKSTLDLCVKSRGAEKIKEEAAIKKSSEVAKKFQEEQKRLAEQVDLSKVKLTKPKVSTYDLSFGNQEVYFGGIVKNDNNYDIQNLGYKIEFFNKNNKIDEYSGVIPKVFYANSVNTFSLTFQRKGLPNSFTFTVILSDGVRQ